MEKIYQICKERMIALFQEEENRLKVNFDPSQNYSEMDLSELIGKSSNDLYESNEWLDGIGDGLRELWDGEQSPRNQNDINDGYKFVATKISIKKGWPLSMSQHEIEDLFDLIDTFDTEFSAILKCKFTFLRDQFSIKTVGLDGDTTINLRIDNALSKCWSFFGSSLASFLHLLRSCCNSEIGILSRIILSRALFEVAIHNIYITRKLQRISKQIEGKSNEFSIEKLELFNSHFLKGMFGSKSPEVNEDHADPFHILSCIQDTKKSKIGDLNFELLNDFYSLLCDYAHPNYLMRNLICEVGPAKGVMFSHEVFVDKYATGNFNANKIFPHLIKALNYSIQIIKESHNEMIETFTILNKINNSKNEQYQVKLTAHLRNESK